MSVHLLESFPQNFGVEKVYALALCKNSSEMCIGREHAGKNVGKAHNLFKNSYCAIFLQAGQQSTLQLMV